MGLQIVSYQENVKNRYLDSDESPILGHYIYKDANGNIQLALSTPPPSSKEVIIFTKQLATMLQSGVPLIQSLSLLTTQQANRFFTIALKDIKREVEEGKAFSTAIAEYPEIFDDLYVAMAEAGEASGNLDNILVKLVSYIERASKIKDQVKSALMYPVVVFIVAIVVVSGLLTFVVPTFASQFSDSGQELPALTQFVVDLSDFIVENWVQIFGSMFASVLSFRFFINTKKGRVLFDKYILKAPIIGDVLKKIAVGRFCSTISSMLQAGVNLLEALNICAASSGNTFIEKFVLNVRENLEQGEKFSKPLSEGDLFPDMVISMVSVGEETGALDEMLAKISDFYEEEVDLAVATMRSMIEPIMIVFIGGVVAFIVIAMYLPIFDMAGTVA